MDVSSLSSALERDSSGDQNTVEADLDCMDLDIDSGSMDHSNEPTAATDTISAYAVPASQIADSELVPHKIHIRGLEDLTTSDIKAFSAKHYPSKTPLRVEWIDDTSANLVFEDKETAVIALQHLTLSPNDNALLPLSQLRVAKPSSTRPESSLYVRIGAITDQKRPRAYEASRFYMMHPEHDPREQRRRGVRSRGNGDYLRKRYSDDEHRPRRRRDREDRFDASMYDDRGISSRRGSISSSANECGTDGTRSTRLRGDSYRPARDERNGARTSRDRSASPNRRNRSTPPPVYRSRDPHPFPHLNKGKELFPSRSTSDRDFGRNDKDLFSSKMLTADVTKGLYSTHLAMPRETASNGKDLFGNRMRAAEVKKELFPHKVNPSKHSRSDAFDAADETADLFANGMSVPFTDRLSSRKSPISRPSSIFQPQVDNGDVGIDLNIRGASRKQNQGISIRGGAAVGAIGTIKELFPEKTPGNVGKELFAEKIEARGGKRNRAADMFY